MPEEYIAAWEATRVSLVHDHQSWSGHERSHTFINLGGARFADVSRLSGADDEGDGRAVASVDWDDDGRLDLVLRSRSAPRLQLFQNRYAQPGNFIAVELEGNGTSCNTDAINSRVVVKVGRRELARTLYGGEGFLSQSTKRLNFGLGTDERVDSVTIHWSDGSTSKFEDLVAGKRYRIAQAEGAGGLHEIPARTHSGKALASVEDRAPQPLGSARRAVLASELPLGEFPIPSFTDPDRLVKDLAGGPVLLNFWQVECEGCLKEFSEFRTKQDRISKLGVRIVTLNADEEFHEERARAMLKKFEIFDQDAGYIGDVLPRLIDVLTRHVYGEKAITSDMAMPTSYLLDAQGQLMVIYHGPVDIYQLEADVQMLNSESQHPTLNRLSNGIRLVHDKRRLFEFGEALEQAGFPELGRHYHELDRDLRGFFWINGERKTLRDFRYDKRGRKGPPKN